MLDRVFSNRYRLVEKLGIGGMAEVYKATDEVLGRTVAIKVMLPQYASDPTFAARFKQEAQSAANLQSPYIVNIYDWGYESTDGIYFIVMEYVRGTDLKTAIQQRGAINQRKAAEIGSQVCSALSVAHGYDIIHRDIKPHNIMVQPDGNAKVMDFGIARASGSSMTQTGSVLGTAYYVSPEQAQGKPLTPATDLYSLGVVLYEATTGKVPFDAPDAVSVALKQVNELPVPPSQLNPDIDPELETIILRAMSKNPLDRYSTAEQMRTALNNYLAGRPIDTGVDPSAAKTRVLEAGSVLPVISADGAQPPMHTAVMPSLAGQQQALNVHSSSKMHDEEQKRHRRNTTILGIVIALVVLIGAGIVIYAVMTSGGSQVTVPNVVGATEQEARDSLTQAQLKPAVSMASSDTVDSGLVISSDPTAGTKVDKDSTVNLVVSSGKAAPKKVSVPDLTNLSPDDAQTKLESLNLVAKRGDDRFDANVPSGQVCAQDTDPNTQVDEGTTITFYASKGKDTVPLSNFVGSDYGNAEDQLTAQGFKVVYTDQEYSDDYAVGMVMKQSPGSGTVDRGSTVTLTVSMGPQPVTVPDLTGMTQSAAQSALQALGLLADFQDQDATELAQLHMVVDQDPGAGDDVSPGSTVTVYIGVEPAAPATTPSTP